MNYYPHHIGDFVRDTSRLSDSQCMAYLRLIWLYYESEQPLANDVQRLAFQIGSDEKTVELLLQCFFYANAERWHHKRIDAEIEAYKTKSIKASESAKARWKNAKDMRTHSEGNANQEPIINNQYKEKKTKTPREQVALPDGVEQKTFDDFLKLRKAKRAPLTETALKGIESQAIKAGMTVDQVLKLCCQKGWAGFEASWIEGRQVKSMQGKQTSHMGFDDKDYSAGVLEDGTII